MKLTRIALVVTMLLAVTWGYTQNKEKKAPPPPPNVVGEWTGFWGIYAPPMNQGEAPVNADKYSATQKKMDCKVEKTADGKWAATFEGECGRPYKYTIKMIGRQAGGSVLFQGTADLGPNDGGVFDWIGRATDKELVGFFTSGGYTGNFRLKRSQ